VGWVDALRGKTVGLDTAPLIYFIEQSPRRIEKLRPFFAAAGREHFRLTTSVITLLEVLVHPLRNGRFDLVRAYRDILLRSPALRAIAFDPRAAEEAGGSARPTTCGRQTRSKSRLPSSRELRIS